MRLLYTGNSSVLLHAEKRGRRMRFDEESHARRPAPFAILRLALMRMARGPWLLVVVAVGVLAIDILACTVPLYLKLITTSQLRTTIAQAPTSSRNMLISVHSSIGDQALHQRITREVEAQAEQNLASFSARQPLTYLTSDSLALEQAGSYKYEWPNEVHRTQFDVFDYSVALPHMRLIAGALPPASSVPPGQPMPVLITQEMADSFNLQVGQRVAITHYGDSLRLIGKETIFFALVTGIWTPKNINDPFWNGFSFASVPYNIKYAHQAYGPPLWPLLTTEANLYATLSRYTRIGVTQNWVYYTDPARITTGDSAAIIENITTLRTHLTGNLVNGNLDDMANTVHVDTTGRLDQLIAGVQQQLNLLALPLYMVAIQIVALAVLFVAAMARLLVTAQEQEIVTLKSRGASSPQVLGVLTAQSVPPGVLAAVIGPLLAVGLALLLVRTFLPGNAADLASLTGLTSMASLTTGASLSRTVAHVFPIITPAIVGSVLGIGVVIASGFSVARLDVLAFRRELARPTHMPVWRRYHLDLALAVLCVVGYLELSQFGTTQSRLQLATPGANTTLLLLIAPALLLLAGGLLLLRLVPLAARLGARLAQRGRGLPALLALAQIARTPTRYTRMILLLALAVGLGVFALVFDASLTQNVQDRLAYATGGDIRLETFTTVGGQEASAYSQRLRSLTGVAAVTSVYRTNGAVQIGQSQQTADMLGVDPGTFANVADATSWRSDYAGQSLPTLMAQMRVREQRTDAGSQAHPLWAIISGQLAQHARLHVGDRFQVSLADISYKPTSAVVGAIIAEFPTLYPNNAPGGFIVFNAHDLNNAIVANALPGTVVGANEFWLRTVGDAMSDRVLVQTLDEQAFHFSTNAVNGIQSYREQLARAEANPINGGMRGLLLLGAFVAALLAVVGSVTQAVLAARQRTRPFAVLRTLGLARHQLTGVLLREQLVVYLFGLVGGTVLGLILMSATVPYLQFSDSLIDPSTVGVPAYLLRINWPLTGVFYGALLVAFVLALVVTARFAATLGLGKTLRIGED
jgi:ABC-type lipoprotein release transport system permease subunit